MNRPLLITDCDEVLLHMAVPFRDWLAEAHDVQFDLERPNFADALRRKACGTLLEKDHVWELLTTFFDSEMSRQTPIKGALEALHRIGKSADIVILTNITERAHQNRVDQLRRLGIDLPVVWNQGGKGSPLARIVQNYKPSVTVFVDDIADHHASVEQHAPTTWRLHLVGEPLLAPHIAPAERAHLRLDTWSDAEPWIVECFQAGPALKLPDEVA